MLIPLRVYSEYSLLTSCIRYADAIDYCKKNKIDVIGVADENNMFGIMPWSLALQDAGIKPIVGCALAVMDHQENKTKSSVVDAAHVWVYCKSEVGYVSLSNLLSDSYLQYSGVLPLELVKELKDCFILVDHELEDSAIEFLATNIDSTCDLGIAISRQKNDSEHEHRLFAISNKLDIPIVAAPKFYYPKPENMLALDALWCIKDNTYLAEVDRKKPAIDGAFISSENAAKMFCDIPQALENAKRISQKCEFVIKKHAPRMPGIDTNEEPTVAFRNKVEEGLAQRLNTLKDQSNENIARYKQRAENEIAMITKMGFCEYFLIVAEIVQWAKKNDIPVGPGRGSGASCLAAWSLQITNIDPMQFNLMFERFLNPDRVSLPDFDIDFCQKRRHEVIEFIQTRFGKENVAHIITFGSLQYRAAIRDIGRVMQLPYTKIDELCKKLPMPIQGVAPTIKELREDGRLQEFITDETKELFMIAESIEGLPRHSSVHAAGVVIGNQRLSDILPLFKDPALDMPIIQFSMKPAEQIGLVKFDILGLSVLSMLHKTCEFLQARGVHLNLDDLPLDDEPTFAMLQKGMVKAVFQLDSGGFRNLMIEMKPTCFQDIIAAGALYRPGPMKDIPQFVRCKNGLEQTDYLYQQMENILKETYGVIVYQEQVLQIAKEMAGYSLKDADLLRRAMGKKIKAEMAMHQEKFVQGIMATCGGSQEKAQTLFDNLTRFASYGFAKAHSAPYAIMTYQTAYCKKHYTAEFLTATLFYEHTQEKAEEIMQEANKMGIEIVAPCVNRSLANFSLNDDHTKILYGLSCIKGVGEIANEIVAEREKNGVYKSIDNFIARINPNKKVLENFVMAGAFDCFSVGSDEHSSLSLDKKLTANDNALGDSRANQWAHIANVNKESTISLFDFQEEVAPWTSLEVMQKEFDTMHTIFNASLLQRDFSKMNLYNKLVDIKQNGFLLAIGLGDNMRKTKEGKIMFSYKFIDAHGCQEILINAPYGNANNNEGKWQYLIIEVERTNVRHVIKGITTLEKFMARYRKIFLDISEIDSIDLKPGDTSIYNAHTKELIGDYSLTIEFFDKMQPRIEYVA